MDILEIVILIFIILETLNVIILYFKPDSRLGNGVAVFNEWEKSKKDENAHLFAEYMTSWVAGTKLIFITLLLVILLVGNEITKIAGVVVVILSILTYFFKLNPIMHKLDKRGEITPKGYSKKLLLMIISFILMFLVALAIYFIN